MENFLNSKKGENGKYGFVDSTGKWVVEPKFVDISNLSKGFARVRLNDKIFLTFL